MTQPLRLRGLTDAGAVLRALVLLARADWLAATYMLRRRKLRALALGGGLAVMIGLVMLSIGASIAEAMAPLVRAAAGHAGQRAAHLSSAEATATLTMAPAGICGALLLLGLTSGVGQIMVALYEDRDLDRLLALPIPPAAIVLWRVGYVTRRVYIVGLGVALPALLGYGVALHAPPWFALLALGAVVTAP